MRIVIIGTGNTATVLGKLLFQKGHSIIQIFGRRIEHARQLAEQLDAQFTSNKKSLDGSGDLYLVAVSDDAIKEVASWLSLDKKLVVHTAASVQMDELSACSKNYGVLYPLQTLRKEVKEIPPIPFLVNANTPDNGSLLSDCARTISNKVIMASEHQRSMTHIAAVFVSNFTNHMYVMAEEFCRKENIDFTILHPLIKEVADRVASVSPSSVQTGPAVRNDKKTIQKHLELLSPFSDQKFIYEIMTESILKKSGQ